MITRVNPSKDSPVFFRCTTTYAVNRIDNACALCYNKRIKSEVIPMHSKSRFCLNDRAFSLIELIVVIAVMAILAAVAIPTFAYFITQAKEASDIAFMNDLEHAIMLVHAEEDEGEISGVIVTINKTNGSIKKIEYQVTFVKTEELADNESAYIHTEVRPITANESKALSEIMDFDYKFKAIDSINDEGKMDNKHWKNDSWTLALIATSDNQESPQDPPLSEDQSPSGNQNSSGDQPPPWAFDENLE